MRRRLCAVLFLAAALARVQAAPVSLAEFPFQFREGFLWIEANIPQSKEPLHFLMDTGAGVSVINLHTAQRLRLKRGERVSVRGVHSTVNGYWPTRLSAKIGEIVLPTEYLGVDLLELSQACDWEVDGLLGADFFNGRVVQIDFTTQQIRFLRSSEVTGGDTVVELKANRRALLAPVRVNGSKPQWMRLDTGCTSALQWVAGRTREVSSKRSVSIGLTELDILMTTTTVQLGGTTFDNVPTGLHKREIFSGERGLLGNGLLSRFERVTIDARAGKLILHSRRAGQ